MTGVLLYFVRKPFYDSDPLSAINQLKERRGYSIRVSKNLTCLRSGTLSQQYDLRWAKYASFALQLFSFTFERELAEGKGFEPLTPPGVTVFKTVALNHSATLPIILEPIVGIEPTTCCLQGSCSTIELYWQKVNCS